MYNPPKNQSNFDDVGDFHTKFGLESVTSGGAHPREVMSDLIEFRIKFMFEELLEFCSACSINVSMHEGRVDLQWNGERGDAPEAFDALIDLVYVAMGTAHLFGFPWKVGWDMVQRANMRKVRAERAEQSERGGTWDVVKPPGWRPPDIQAVLYTHGWDVGGYAMPAMPETNSEDKK